MYLPSKLGKHAPAMTLRLICQMCGGKGWVQAAPIEDSDGIDYHYVRSSRVGTFTPVPCWLCSSPATFVKAS